MDPYKEAEKSVRKIVDSVSHIAVSTELIANMLSKQPGIIQYRIWKVVRSLIEYWKITARYGQYESQYEEIYKWAERVDND